MNYNFETLPFSVKTKLIVFSDFDSTYFNHTNSRLNHIEIKKFEKFLMSFCKHENALFGLVSGASIDHITSKLQSGKYSLFPSFIASSFGAEIHYYSQGELKLDTEWEATFPNDDEMEKSFDQLILQTKLKGLALIATSACQKSRYKRSYYLCSKNNPIEIVHITLEECCSKYNIAFNVSQTNPDNGDPEGHYDIDFFPNGAGKGVVIDYLCRKFHVNRKNTIAFGDSCNDIPMLQAVKHGYLVGNATSEAKVIHKNHLGMNHLAGIVEGISKHYDINKCISI